MLSLSRRNTFVKYWSLYTQRVSALGTAVIVLLFVYPDSMSLDPMHEPGADSNTSIDIMVEKQ